MSPFPLTSRFTQALAFATDKHEGQYRKGTTIPYISHPVAVCSLVLEYGGSEDQAIGALLHDTMEDCDVLKSEIAERYGQKVAQIVADCTDTELTPKPPWRARKEKYIEHLAEVDASTLLVSACDKLHNARAITHDVSHEGPAVWRRFTAGPAEVIWYYESLLSAFKSREAEGGGRFSVLLRELNAAVGRMKSLSG